MLAPLSSEIKQSLAWHFTRIFYSPVKPNILTFFLPISLTWVLFTTIYGQVQNKVLLVGEASRHSFIHMDLDTVEPASNGVMLVGKVMPSNVNRVNDDGALS